MTAKRIANHSAMTVFAKEFPDEITQQAVAQLPWGHILCQTARANRLGKGCIAGQMQHRFSAKGAQYDSPGQRPGFVRSEELRALKGRHKRSRTISKLDGFLAVEPGAAIAQFAESAKLEQAIKANLRGLRYGG